MSRLQTIEVNLTDDELIVIRAYRRYRDSCQVPGPAEPGQKFTELNLRTAVQDAIDASVPRPLAREAK